MNKRQHKKQIKHIIKSIKTIKLDKDELLLFRFNKSDYNYEQLNNIAQIINNTIAPNKAIFLPSDISISKVTSSDKSISTAMKNFKVTPYEEVQENLSEATKKTIERLDKRKDIHNEN